MQNWGYHVVPEVYGCHPEVLGDVQKIQDAMVNAAEKAGAEICKTVFHQYQSKGVSGAVVTRHTHAAIHTWVDMDCAVIDIFSCSNTREDLDKACSFLAEKLGAHKWVISTRQKDHTPEPAVCLAANM